MINLGFKYRLRRGYECFEAGEFSLEYFAREMRLIFGGLYALLDGRGLPASNIGARSATSIH